MPTGYTAALEEHWDVSRWLKQDVVRALGVCVCMRDEGDLTEEQILKALSPNQSGSYYEKSLRESQQQLDKALGKSAKTWANELKKSIEEASERWSRNKREIGRKAIEYRSAIKKIEDFQSRAKNEGGKCVAKFALEQLALVKDEFEPTGFYERHLMELKSMTVSDFAASQITSFQRSVAIAKQQLQEEQQRNRERLEFYKGLLADCREIFGS